MLFLNKKGRWEEVNSFYTKDKKFYINNKIISGETHVKDVCSICGIEYTNKKLYNFTEKLCSACKRKKTNIEKYGVENVYQSQEIKEKIKQTNLERRGVDSPAKSKEARSKYKQTMLDRYGVETNLQTNENKEKLREILYTDEINKKRQASLLNKTKDEKKAILERRKKTNQRKFNVDWVFLSDEINNKKIQTHKKNYGVAYPAQHKETLKKQEKAKLEKYGNKNNFEKLKLTCLEKYGAENPSQILHIKNKKINTIRKNYYNNISFDNVSPMFNKDEYMGVEFGYKWKCEICGNHFYSDLMNGKTPRCLVCFPKFTGTSLMEKEIIQWLKGFDIKVVENDRELIGPKELDIYLPGYNIAIEFDGLYWHSEQAGTAKSYHLEKTQRCEEKSVQLIHIFEDEWLYKQNIVKSRLKNILGLNNRRIGARETEIREISPKEKNSFLNTYHIQGEDRSAIKLGAFYNNELVGVMTFSRPRIFMNQRENGDIWELSRFATISDTYTPGLASKMLKHFERNYKWDKIYSYADRRWSLGGLYYKLGFKFEYFTQPNYWYFNSDKKRKHRYNFRKLNLKNFFNYSESKTEKQIMDESGWHRIYDCGNIKFIK